MLSRQQQRLQIAPGYGVEAAVTTLLYVPNFHGICGTRVRRPVIIQVRIRLLLPVLMLLLVARLPTNTSVLDGHLVHPEQLDASIQKLPSTSKARGPWQTLDP